MHSNPNAVAPLLAGITQGEAAAAHGDGGLAEAYTKIDELTAPFPVGGFRLGNTHRAKEIASAQGFVAAYRSATEFPGERRKRAGYETLVAYWVSLGISEAEARAAAQKLHPTVEPASPHTPETRTP